jgi:hypothetical protein
MKNDTPRPTPYEIFVAECTANQANELINYDHHRVVINGCDAVMLTYHWREDLQEPLLVKAVFEYAELHPPAPPEVQAVIDQLQFRSSK